jgi:carbamoyltransferase
LLPVPSNRHESAFIDYTVSLQHLLQKVPRFDAARSHKGAEGVLDSTWVNLARQVQGLLEEDMVFLAGRALARTTSRRLCLAGGVALSCVTNRRIYDAGICDEMFIQPASSDEGVPLGCALAGYYISGGRCRTVMQNAYLGAANDSRTAESVLRRSGMSFRRCDDRTVANLLAEGRIVGRVFGGAEYGPRALGNRSILADPRRPYMTEVLNRRVKHRELFRPFAPSCHADKVQRYFDMPVEGPFMIFAAPVKPGARHLIPAIVHVDGSCRPQTVRPDQNPAYYKLIEEFGRLTGIYCLINTSFNDNSEPIVETYEDALASFLKTGLDHLYIDGYLVDRPAVETSLPGVRSIPKSPREVEEQYEALAEKYCELEPFRRLRAELESRVEQPASRRDLLDVA